MRAGRLVRSRRGVPLAWLAAAVLAAATASSIRVVWKMDQLTHPPRVPVPSLAEAPELEGFREVLFEAADGTRLSGWWAPSANGAAVVLAHGRGANREQMLPQAQMLRSSGFGVLVFDLRAHGKSGGERCTYGDREWQDVSAAIGVASGEPGVDPNRIGAVGFSLGALALSTAAARDPRLRAVVLEAGAASLEELLRHDFASRWPFSSTLAVAAARLLGIRVDEVRPLHRLREMGQRPLLLVYGERDETIPPAVGERMRAAAGGAAELFVVPNGRHGGWEKAAPNELKARLRGFFERTLREAPALPLARDQRPR